MSRIRRSGELEDVVRSRAARSWSGCRCQGSDGFNFMAQIYGCIPAKGVWVVPGSHRLGKVDIKAKVAEARTERLPDAVPMVCAPGVVANCNCQHERRRTGDREHGVPPSRLGSRRARSHGDAECRIGVRGLAGQPMVPPLSGCQLGASPWSFAAAFGADESRSQPFGACGPGTAGAWAPAAA